MHVSHDYGNLVLYQGVMTAGDEECRMCAMVMTVNIMLQFTQLAYFHYLK